MNEIKVTVAYENPITTKFDALMTEYEAAKQLADETVAYYKPLADVAEEAKFDAIMEQLETIKGYAKHIGDIKNEAVWIRAYISSDVCGNQNSGGQEFEVIYRPKETSFKFEIRSAWKTFDRKHIEYHTEGCHNFIGNWDKWKVYDKLEKEACRQLKKLIDNQAERAQHQINRLNNIVK